MKPAGTLRVATVVGTRPEIIRLSRTLAALDRHTDHILIHTGQNYDYGLSQVFFDQLELRPPDHHLDAAEGSALATIGAILTRLDPLLDEIAPDALLVLGDTNSCLAVIAAKRKQIPVFHMEAGNRCHDDRVPEEINRRLVDHLSDVNLPYSDLAREYLLREGLPPERVIKTGSPMREVLDHYAPKIAASTAIDDLGLAAGEYFVVSCHRQENVDDPERLDRLVALFDRLGRTFDRPIVFSAHPRTRKRLEAAGATLHPHVQLLEPLGFFDWVSLQQSARAVLSDSGTITEESSILGFPAVNLRDTHERPEGMEEAAVMLTGLDLDRIFQALEILRDQPRGDARRFGRVRDYEVPVVSEKVVRIILSYTDVVNRVVWRRD
ncbi:MAG: UDP-N-acetylglucosamine 2-epimerase (non-hydrolyzing) [Acidobacteriota bacterium]